ncbi:MAG: DNA-binding beta-propeller fold protein YncE [Cryomorphaceae bacterium]|jgi:DNA-binding beta-propeller fold protein YncE
MKLNASLKTIIVTAGVTLAIILVKSPIFDSLRTTKLVPRVFGSVIDMRMIPTQVFFDTYYSFEVISDFKNHRFVYRDLANGWKPGVWQQTQMSSLKRPHAITYHPATGKYFAVDTSNHQVISFNSLSDSNSDIQRYSILGNHAVGKRPHDIAFNSSDGYIYVVINTGIIRFSLVEKKITDVTFVSKKQINQAIRKKYPDASFAIGYTRSISIVDGIVYLVNSTQSNIIQFNSFSEPDSWTAHINKDRPKKYA